MKNENKNLAKITANVNTKETEVNVDPNSEDNSTDIGCDVLRQKIVLDMAGAIFMLIFGIVFLCRKMDATVSLFVFALALVFFGFAWYKRYLLKTKQYQIITASCINYCRSGYRKQYFNYDFQIIDNESIAFTIETASKRKFKKGFTYQLCFKTDKDHNKLPYTANNLLGFSINQ